VEAFLVAMVRFVSWMFQRFHPISIVLIAFLSLQVASFVAAANFD
jgi:hypothetical protein